jgi:lipopolysaccharide/colanic/teichoic acid biosynthesis glycosyltransferase
VPAPPTQVEPEAIRSLVWPRRPASSIGATVALAVALCAPVAVAAPDPLLAAVAAVPILALTYVTRLVFEAILPHAQSRLRRVGASVLAAAFGVACVAATAAILAIDLPTRGLLIGEVGAALVLAAAAAIRVVEQQLGTSNRQIVFVGPAWQYAELAGEISRRGDLKLAGHLNSDGLATDAGEDITSQLDAMAPRTLVLSGQAAGDQRLVAASARLHARGVRIRSLGEFYEQEFRKVAMSDLSPSWFLFDVAAIHRHRLYGVPKRVIETLLAGSLLVLSAPLFPIVALATRLSSPGPILFHQVRIGRNGEHIRLSKFRTMVLIDGAPAAWATAQSDRITTVGRWLRRFRLDELPQLVSVVRGDLALVGPRPEQPAIVAQLREKIEFYDTRHWVRPGLTGWAQVNHGYGASVHEVTEKLRYELFYIKHQSVMLDMRIIVATVRTILSGHGR